MDARDLMTSPVVTVSVDGTVGDAADLTLRHGVSCLPVVDAGGRVVGMLTHSGFGLHHRFLPTANHLYTLFGVWASPANLEQASQQVRGRLLREVMSQPVAEVAEAMMQHRVHRLPVMRGDEMVGVISPHPSTSDQASLNSPRPTQTTYGPRHHDPVPSCAPPFREPLTR